ncbi:GAF domain-containing protein [Micromonospora pisi]|uniref:GAF domain-containing protein n=1 Tax=Micromonospora pisi TaxID=589240 RepID=A0A495JF36_9ACTN|nr:GAF and ANTAR domain-containing protein [Micromonospora pisi]RKR87630.1 GAF domain-containing protein [Micromonospora pisi]
MTERQNITDSGNHERLVTHLTAMARQLLTGPDQQVIMETILTLAPVLVPGCEETSITMLNRRRPTVLAASNKIARGADELQCQLGEGPCLTALAGQDEVLCNDLSRDNRWLLWGPSAVQEFGLLSILSVRLFADRRTLGSLNLYATQRHAYDIQARQNALVLATHSTVALLRVKEHRDMLHGLERRATVGQACGILMERYQLSASAAFDLLVRVSQNTNTKLHIVAMRLVETRTSPWLKRPSHGATTAGAGS